MMKTTLIAFKRFVLLAMVLFGASVAVAEQPKQAVMSDKAATSLLLDVTRAGERLVAVGDRGHILYSDDNGSSWTQSKVPTIQLLTAVDFVDGNSGWAVGHDALILTTSDGGITWTEQYQDPDAEVPLLDVWFRDPYVGFAVGAYGTILMTNNGGKTWSDWRDHIENEDEFHYNAITALQDGTLIVAGEAGILYRSVDGGEQFDMIESPYEGSFFGVLPTQKNHSGLVYGLRGHIFQTNDSGETWERIKVNTGHGLFGGRLLDDGSLVIAGHSGTILKSYDGGTTLTLKNRANRLIITGVAQAPNGNLILVGQGGIHRVASNGDDLKQPAN
ncbi:YCF48-related protein [Aestuariirhabdus sp. Z084]|uniref:WD40/YVTN/BNR-like repeat-containing protein n=1 Tax=Aestuariirhabdus haliotis TaxID=2918751 RepID=UPI00201B45BD|nr:YCF48-related protein [Aestuariirhabdus haliotis]MCL6414612.1 YCF48-related protein [Aestuariirhabdus haliotis]MCL6418406.1 YCF48-related protein [Aestuariirhabdus haliotis]